MFHYIRVSKKFVDKRGEGGRQYQDVLSKMFCLKVPEKIVRASSSVSIISGIKKVYRQEGDGVREYQDIPKK